MNMTREYVSRQLGYCFLCPSYLELALTHSSYSRTNNERLEFLGDSILNMVVAEWLYLRSEGTEGQMAQARAKVVCTDNLYRTAIRLGVGPMLTMGNSELASGGRDKVRILANALEAIIGAIYLDTNKGYDHARNFIARELIPYAK